MGNLFSVCLPRIAVDPGSSADNAGDRHESTGIVSRSNQPLAPGNSPRTAIMTRVRENWIAANAVTTAQMSRRGAHGPRHRAAQQALSNVSNFYQKQLFRKLNMHCMSEDQEEEATDYGHSHVLDRKVSFLSIAPQLNDIDVLTRGAPDQPLQQMDNNSRAALEEVLRTIMLNYHIVEADAVTGAQRGERGMPLTLDHERFGNFLAEREALLTGIIDACGQGDSRSASLAPLLQALATDYFETAGRMPNGLLPDMQQTFQGYPVSNEPVTVLLGDFDESGGQHLVDAATEDEKVLLMLGTPVVTGPLSLCQAMRKGFEAHCPAAQRAAVVLQTLFCGITNVEESIIGSGIQCRTDNECIQSSGTAKHIDYTGSTCVGDGCDHSDENGDQRWHASAPLQKLPQLLQEHEAAYQAPLLTDPELKGWIEDPCFGLSVLSIAYPKLRLPFAQLATTGKLLLQSKAFGGAGIALNENHQVLTDSPSTLR